MTALLREAVKAITLEREAARSRGIELLGVVGSVARGEERADSDVDIVYRLVGKVSLLALARELINLRAVLGREVDLIDFERVDPDLRLEFERDLVPS